jgi:SAM-dependent methyltransferase
MKKLIKKLIMKYLYPSFEKGVFKVLQTYEAANILAMNNNIKYKNINTETLRYINDVFLEYHHNIILDLDRQYSLANKVILDVGGTNIPADFMRDLEVKQFICIDPITKYLGFHNCSPVSQHNGKKVYSKNDIISSLPDEFCYIIDTDIEDANDIFKNYFDFIISISTFEHVTDIGKSLQIIHNFLRTGGILHSQYEPIFTCPVGHHLYIDKDINFTNRDLNKLDNVHLLYTKDEARELIKEYFDFNEDVINTALYQIYDSSIINRKTFNEHILEIVNSPFNNYSIDYFSKTPPDPLIQEKLIDKFGFMRFDIRGLKLRCTKD